MNRQKYKKQIKILLERLERISADSVFAHRANGIRGSFLIYLEDEKMNHIDIDNLINYAYAILDQATILSFPKDHSFQRR